MKNFNFSFFWAAFLGTLAVIFPETALATAADLRTAALVGEAFARPAVQVFQLIDGWGGTLVGVSAVGLGIAGRAQRVEHGGCPWFARRWNRRNTSRAPHAGRDGHGHITLTGAGAAEKD